MKGTSPRTSEIKAHAFITGIAMFLATGTTHASVECDTLHTSDTRQIWRCGEVCVRAMGNPPYYITFDNVKRSGYIVHLGAFKWKQGGAQTATLGGKRCQTLGQTYDYDKIELEKPKQ
jgi:hypothetical protein